MTLADRRKTGQLDIEWTPSDEPATLYISPNADGSRRARIGANLTGGVYEYRMHNLAPGTYYVVSREGKSRSTVGPSFTVDAPLEGRLVSPSYLSGKDYARQVLDDAWDMSNAADVDSTRNVESVEFSGGKFKASSTSASSDPGVFLAVDDTTPIDSDAYFYLTYRMRVRDLDQVSEGAVVRIFYYTGTSVFDVTQDLREYDGWQTVSFDMRDVELEPNADNTVGGWQADPITRLRIDPHENGTGKDIEIDWVKLTGHTTADKNFLIRYTASDDAGDPIVRFYYDTDDTAAGRTRINCSANSPEGTRRWITTEVAEDDYFIQMVLVDDSLNRTTIVSQVPVLVRH